MSARNNGGKDYVVVIEATEVGDPTGGIKFTIANDSVDNLQVKINIEDLGDGDTGENTYTFERVEQYEPVIICQAFSDPDPSNPSTVEVSITFIAGEDDNFILMPQEGINSAFTKSTKSTNTFTDADVPVAAPAYQALPIIEKVFIQCLGETEGNLAFLQGDSIDGVISLQEVYTTHSPGMTWQLVLEKPNHYYIKLDSLAGDYYLHANGENGTLQLQQVIDPAQAPATSWHFLPGNPPDNDNNFYQLESMSMGALKYLDGNTGSGKVNLVDTLENVREMKWYMHPLNIY